MEDECALSIGRIFESYIPGNRIGNGYKKTKEKFYR